MRAIIAKIPNWSISGQSIGFLVPIVGKIPHVRIKRIGERFKNGIYYERVEANILGPRYELSAVAKNCLSVAFHFPISSEAIPLGELARRTELLRAWLQEEFSITEFREIECLSRMELCDLLCSILHVM